MSRFFYHIGDLSATSSHMNRLGQESSPYLLQHRDNPVEWFPWDDEAFEVARKRDVPIFLSIGYATCHWCHVMEHESFEDDDVARLLNDGFVSIKVDREERPDIDQVYMSVCQLMGGSCGWPLTVIMTPDARPFFVATYIPRNSRFGRTGMMDLLPRIRSLWVEDRERVEESAGRITDAVRRIDYAIDGPRHVDRDWLRIAFTQLAERYDPEHGGFGTAPKFPSPHNLLFLLRYWFREREPAALSMVRRTLHRMRRGGIYDQVGFGFHRYSTDREWRLPHFEKMLYDQALHVMAYTEAYLATGESAFAETAREVAEYVMRDLRSTDGAFFSAEDADSEGEEGKFYVWSLDEVRDVLPDHLAVLVASTFGITADGNFLDEASRQRTGDNVLHRGAAGRDEGEEQIRLEEARRLLFDARESRERPLLDDKILTDWNGLMIASLAKLGSAVSESAFTDAAARAADFLLATVRSGQRCLQHRYRRGRAGVDGHLQDHAFLIWGLIELYQATFEVRYAAEAAKLAAEMIDRFWDNEKGGFFMTAADGEKLVARLKDYDDGALPSGNSVGLLCLLRVARITGDARFDEYASRLLESVAPRVARYPAGYAGLLMGMEFVEAGPTEVVLAGPTDSHVGQQMLEILRGHYLPSTVTLHVSPDNMAIAEVAPFVSGFRADSAETLAYACRNHACSRPTGSAAGLLEELDLDREDLIKQKRTGEPEG